jgi:hypothetical protein
MHSPSRFRLERERHAFRHGRMKNMKQRWTLSRGNGRNYFEKHR